MSEDTTLPCRHCNGTGTTVKPPRQPPVPLTEKEWLLYQGDLTTSVLVAVSENLVAVARAYTAETDRYSRKKGRSIAQARMRNFLPIYKNSGVDIYTTEYDNRNKPGHVIFEVVPPDELFDEEEKFFNDVILPKFAAQAAREVKSEPEALISRPEADGCGPVIS